MQRNGLQRGLSAFAASNGGFFKTNFKEFGLMLRRWVTSQKGEIPNHTTEKAPNLVRHWNAVVFTSFYIENITIT
jgi:hypothetical protein